MQKLGTTQEVFDALGGVASVAEITASKYTAVHNWKQYEKFPPRTFVAIQDALQARGLTAIPSLWGMIATSNDKTEAEKV